MTHFSTAIPLFLQGENVCVLSGKQAVVDRKCRKTWRGRCQHICALGVCFCTFCVLYGLNVADAGAIRSDPIHLLFFHLFYRLNCMLHGVALHCFEFVQNYITKDIWIEYKYKDRSPAISIELEENRLVNWRRRNEQNWQSGWFALSSSRERCPKTHRTFTSMNFS